MRNTWVAATIVVILVLGAGIAAYSADKTASTPPVSRDSTADGHPTSDRSSLGSPSSTSVSLGSGTSTTTATTQQYPLAWAGDSPSVCGDLGDLGCCDFASFCISASLRFWNATSSDTTITEGNATTVVRDSTTTIFRTGAQTITCQGAGNSTLATNQTSSVSSSSTTCTSSINTYPETDVISPAGTSTHPVDVTVFVQDAVTGQNITTLSDGCYIQTTLHATECQVGSRDMLAGHAYKVTVLVTAQDDKTLLAPPRTITVTM